MVNAQRPAEPLPKLRRSSPATVDSLRIEGTQGTWCQHTATICDSQSQRNLWENGKWDGIGVLAVKVA